MSSTNVISATEREREGASASGARDDADAKAEKRREQHDVGEIAEHAHLARHVADQCKLDEERRSARRDDRSRGRADARI